MMPSCSHWQEASAPGHVELPKRLLEHPYNMAAALPHRKDTQQKTKDVLAQGPCHLLCIVPIPAYAPLYT